MKFRSLIAVCATLIACMQVGTAMAQSTPDTVAPSSPATSNSDKGAKNVDAPKKKKAAKMARQQEIDKSVDSGTVPARYRTSVPKRYQQYIPFDKQ